MSSRKVSGEDARRATTPRQRAAGGPDPPWQIILEQQKPPSISLYRVYNRAGISKSRRYWLRKAPDLRLSVAYRLAMAAGIDPGKFMVAVARMMEPDALVPDPEMGRNQLLNRRPPRHSSIRCGACGKTGHNRRSCRALVSLNSSSLLLLRARGAAMAANELTSKKGK